MNKDSFKSDIEKDHSYSKSITSKGNCGFLIEQQYADDASLVTNIKTVKESVKSDAPSELKRKNLIVTEECRFLRSLLGNKEDINRRKQLACETFNIYTRLFYVQIRSASNSELEYFKLLYHLYFFIIPSFGLSQKHRKINRMFSKEYSCDKW